MLKGPTKLAKTVRQFDAAFCMGQLLGVVSEKNPMSSSVFRLLFPEGSYDPKDLLQIRHLGVSMTKELEISLQALSEKMIFSSPILSPFDQIVQELLYRQQIVFLEEDELVIPEDEEEQIAMMTHRLERLLQGDLETVIDPSAKREDIPHKIVGELEAYYVEERQHSYYQGR